MRCGPTASCSRASRPACCRWRSGTSCSDVLHATKVLPQGAGLAPVLLRRAATVTLDWDTRQKSRFDFTDSAGRHVGVFLPRGCVVRGGDVLLAEDGSFIR